MNFGHDIYVIRLRFSPITKDNTFAVFNSTLRQGNITHPPTHHEYIQVGKGRDIGLNQIALFEGKVAGGNGEQVLNRDVYRIGQLFDFFRMMSFCFTTVGFYVCTMAFSNADRAISKVAKLSGNTALDAALNAQFLVQIGVFTAVPNSYGYGFHTWTWVAEGYLQLYYDAISDVLGLFHIFSGDKDSLLWMYYLHGGAKYRATGRGFVVQYIKFADNHFIPEK